LIDPKVPNGGAQCLADDFMVDVVWESDDLQSLVSGPVDCICVEIVEKI
jgi:hypothetical protein